MYTSQLSLWLLSSLRWSSPMDTHWYMPGHFITRARQLEDIESRNFNWPIAYLQVSYLHLEFGILTSYFAARQLIIWNCILFGIYSQLMDAICGEHLLFSLIMPTSMTIWLLRIKFQKEERATVLHGSIIYYQPFTSMIFLQLQQLK